MQDKLAHFDQLAASGPRSASIAERRAEAIEDFKREVGFDDEKHQLQACFYIPDATERITISPLGTDEVTPYLFDRFPTLKVPPEIDTLALLRSARDEGCASPLLEMYEATALAARRN